MVLCRNWIPGRPDSCRFGDRCRFEHPQADRSIASNNPFAPLQRDHSNTRNNNGYRSGDGSFNSLKNGFNNGSDSNGQTLPYGLDKNQIFTDLSTERPQWILSAYGPGRNAPEQLFGGPMRERSFEEMRLLHYIGMLSGNSQQAAREADILLQASEQQIQTALNDIDGAINFIINAEKTHPNRIDIVRNYMSGEPQNSNAFVQGNTPNTLQMVKPTSSAFGAPSQPTTSSFGASNMGTTSGNMGTTSGTFGQPSALGSKPSHFGAPNGPAFGTPAFGATSQPVAGGAFGQLSALGQKPTLFGAVSGTSGGFSSFSKSGSAFGQPSQPTTSGAFGAPSQSAPANAFSGNPSTPFGAPSTAPKNPFGAPSIQPPAPNNLFGVPSTRPSAANPAGGGNAPKSNPFATPSATVNQFSNHQSNPSSDSNPFGKPTQSAATNSFSSTPSSYQPATSENKSQHPPLNSYSKTGPDGRLTMFKGRRVVYRNGEPGFERGDRTWEKIWFPQGPPPFNKDTEMKDSAYDDQTKAAYMYVQQTGTFEGDIMPLLPPKREWCLWDF